MNKNHEFPKASTNRANNNVVKKEGVHDEVYEIFYVSDIRRNKSCVFIILF